MLAKLGQDAKMALVLAVCLKSPCVDHVEETHAFEAQELPVAGVGELAVKDQAYSAELADENRSVPHGGEGETSGISVAEHERGSGADAQEVVTDPP